MRKRRIDKMSKKKMNSKSTFISLFAARDAEYWQGERLERAKKSISIRQRVRRLTRPDRHGYY
jgi:hypothetical protein